MNWHRMWAAYRDCPALCAVIVVQGTTDARERGLDGIIDGADDWGYWAFGDGSDVPSPAALAEYSEAARLAAALMTI